MLAHIAIHRTVLSSNAMLYSTLSTTTIKKQTKAIENEINRETNSLLLYLFIVITTSIVLLIIHVGYQAISINSFILAV